MFEAARRRFPQGRVALQRDRRREWRRGVNGLEAARRRFPQGRVAAEDGGRLAEVFGDERVEVFAQEGEDHVAHLVAQDGRVGVRGVLAPREAAAAEVGAQVGIAQAEKGADERDAVHV